jgi:hypothetical protein
LAAENFMRRWRARREAFERAMPPLDRRRAVLALAIGIALFNVAGLILPFEGLMALMAYLLTPLFGIPLAVALWRQHQIRWLGAIYFVLGLTLGHMLAAATADRLYGEGIDFVLPCVTAQAGPAHRACMEEQDARRAAQAPTAGLAAGAVGAALSFLGLMLVARRFRSPRRLAVMAGATVVLSAIGGIGFSLGYPDEMGPAAWILQIFMPWQIVFGATLLLLFDRRATGDTAAERNRYDPALKRLA